MALTRREQTLAAITGVVVFVVVNFFAFGPALEKWRGLDAQILKARASMAEARLLVGKEPELQAEHNKLVARLRKGSAAESGGDVIGRIEQLGKDVGVTFTQRTPSDPVERPRYTEKSAQFTFQASWQGLVKFLFALTKQPEAYRVTTLRMRADSKDPNQLSGEMAIITYFVRGEGAAAGAPKQNSVDKPATAGEDKRVTP